MYKQIRSKNKWVKPFVIFILSLFLCNSFTWAIPLTADPAYEYKLQVQSLFKPILDVTGEIDDTQLRIETALILAMGIKGNISFQDINSELDSWYSSASSGPGARVLNVVRNPVMKDGYISVITEIFRGPYRGTAFEIRSSCEDISDIQQRSGKIKITLLEDESAPRETVPRDKGFWHTPEGAIAAQMISQVYESDDNGLLPAEELLESSIEFTLSLIQIAYDNKGYDFLEGLKKIYSSLFGKYGENRVSIRFREILDKKIRRDNKLILINPNHRSGFMSIKPLGLARIGAYLKEKGTCTTYVDANSRNYSSRELAENIAAKRRDMEGPLVLGISMLPGETEYVKEFLNALFGDSGKPSDIKVCVGGYFPTMTAAQFMKDFPHVDFIIRGEGEFAMAELVSALDGKASVEDVRNLVRRTEDGKVVPNKLHHVLTQKELDLLPPPDYSMLIDEEDLFWKKALLDTSRGCPGFCGFCGLHKFRNEFGSDDVELKRVRPKDIWWVGRSAKKVVDEMEYLHKRYGVTGFDIVDDDFIGNAPERARAIAEEIIKRDLQISFWCLSRSDSVVKAGAETMKRLYEAGLKMVFLGTESFNDEELRFLGKRATSQLNIDAINVLRDAGIEARIGFINFYRESTLGQIEENITQVENLGLQAAIPTPSHMLQVYENTRLYDRYVEEGVELIPMGNDSFGYEFLDEKVSYLYSETKKLADLSYPLMKHFRELQELEYYFPSSLSCRARSVYENLKKIEFDFFKDVLAIVKETAPDKLEERAGSIAVLSEDYYSAMLEEIKWFNRWVDNNHYDARYELPGMETVADPMDRIYGVLREEEDGWIALGDFLKLWNRNSVYGQKFMDIFISEVESVSDSVCRKYGGFAQHLVADEIILYLPKTLSREQAYRAYKEVHEKTYMYFQNRYGFAGLEFSDARYENDVLEHLRQDPDIKGIDKLSDIDANGDPVERYFILFKKGGEDASRKLANILEPVKDKVTGTLDFDVMIPWIPIGAAKASYVPREDGMDLEAWTERIIEEADFMQHYAKEETRDLVAISDAQTAILRSMEDETPSQLFTVEESAGLNNESRSIQDLLRKKRYRTEKLYPSFSKPALRTIVKDSLFYSGHDVMACKVDVGYDVQNSGILSSFFRSSGSRELRKNENGRYTFGFKAIQGTFGHKTGNELILYINICLDRVFRQDPGLRVNIIRGPPDRFYLVFERTGGRLPSSDEILQKIDMVKKTVDDKIRSLGIRGIFQVSTIQSDPRIPVDLTETEKEDRVRIFIQTLNLLSESREAARNVQSVSRDGTVLKEYGRILTGTGLERMLKSEQLKIDAHQRKRSKGILKELNEKYPPRVVMKESGPDRKPVVLMLGYPASGKGTLGRQLADRLGFADISMGEIMRGLMKKDPGLNVDEYPGLGFSELSNLIQRGEINLDNGLILDSNAPVPGWRAEFEKFMEDNGLYLASVVHVEVDEDTARHRMRTRGRKDDFRRLREDPRAEMIEIRLRNHREKVMPMIEAFREEGYVIEVDNNASMGQDEMGEVISSKVPELCELIRSRQKYAETVDILTDIEPRIRQLALEAGRIMLGDRQKSGLRTRTKKEEGHGTSPVTETDEKLQQLVDSVLMDFIPGSIVIGEESHKKDPGLIRKAKSTRYVWVVDPIDGTRAFESGGKEYGLAISLMEHGRPVFSMYYAPELRIGGHMGCMFEASMTRDGAYLNGEKIHVSGAVDPGEAVCNYHSQKAFREAPFEKTVIRRFGRKVPLTHGFSTSARFCMVAAGGDYEGLPALLIKRIPQIWDVIPGAYILEKAGGTVMFGDGMPVIPFDFDRLIEGEENPRMPDLAACSGGLKDIVAGDLAEVRKRDHKDTEIHGDTGTRELSRSLEVIRDNNNLNFQVFYRVKKYFMALLEETRAPEETHPVDIVVDISLFPEDQDELDAYMETWAYLILMCRKMENVNFIFEYPYEEKPTGREGKILRVLRSKLDEKTGPDESDRRFIKTRLTSARRTGAVEVPIFSKDYLEWARNKGMKLHFHQYPVAMEKLAGSDTESLMGNFHAALTIGLAKSALVLAKRRDEEKGQDSTELPLLKKTILAKLQSLYDVFFDGEVMITDKTLDRMIDDSPEVRLNLAISLALPPLVRIASKYIQNCHNEIQLLLQAA